MHTDVCGPITPKTWDGKRYFLTFVDDCTHFTVAYLIASRDEVAQRFRDYKAMVEAGFGVKLARLRSDNGGEYISREMQEFCRQSGVVLEYTMSYTPEQNGTAERMNRTLVEKARAMIYESGLPKDLWGEAVMSSVFVTNRSPTNALVVDETPAEMWYGEKPDLSGLRVFGCKAYSHIPKHKRGKFDPKSKEYVMIGYAINGYRLWDPVNRKVHLSRDVIFDEADFPALRWPKEGVEEIRVAERVVTQDNLRMEIVNAPVGEPEDGEHQLGSSSDTSDDPATSDEQFTTDEEFHTLQEDDVQQVDEDLQEDPTVVNVNALVPEDEEENTDSAGGDPLQLPRRSGRNRKAPAWLEDYDTGATAMIVEGCEADTPSSYADIFGRENEECWKRAVQEELRSLNANETWEVVPRPRDAKVISGKWIFKTKLNKNGDLERYKARLVARGFMQKQGVDFQETYAPVAKLATVRFLLAIGIQLNFYFCHMDVVTAFLYGHLEKPVFMTAPEGVDVPDGMVLKLKRSLYGLKQSPKCWNNRFHEFVVGLGFRRSEADYCLYVRIDSRGTVYLLLYVDDLMICGDNEVVLQELKEKLSSEFRMKDLGNVEYFMGLQIEIDRSVGKVTIGQSTFAENILARFHMQSCNRVTTPIEPGTRLDRTKSLDTDVSSQYRQLIGSLMYLMLGSRPDLCFAVSYFSRFQDCANQTHWNSLKRVLRYLKGTSSYELVYTRNTDAIPIRGFVDSDWANDLDDRRSTSGYLFEVYGNTVCWTTKKQGLVAVSTTEAEYIAAASAVAEAMWFKKLFTDVQIQLDFPIQIMEDNQGCLFVAKNPETKRTKHVDVKYHMVREKVWNKEVELVYVASQDQTADGLTKPLPRGPLEKFCSEIGLERGGV